MSALRAFDRMSVSCPAILSSHYETMCQINIDTNFTQTRIPRSLGEKEPHLRARSRSKNVADAPIEILFLLVFWLGRAVSTNFFV